MRSGLTRTILRRRQLDVPRPPVRIPAARRSLHRLSELPRPTPEQLSDAPRLTPVGPYDIPPESSTMAIKRQTSSNMHLSKWTDKPQGVLVVQKPDDPRTNEAVGRMVESVRLWLIWTACLI